MGQTFRVEELQSNRLWLYRLLNITIVGKTIDGTYRQIRKHR